MSFGAAHPHELDTLMRYLAERAREIIAEHGEVFPLAAAIDRSLGTAAFAVDEGGDLPDAESQLHALTAGLQRGVSLGDFIATGLLVNVTLLDPGGVEQDALSIHLDHIGGASFRVLFPYSVSEGEVWLGNPRVTEGEHRMFPPT